MSAAFEDAVCGAVASVASTVCAYPLDVAKTRLQAQRRSRPCRDRSRSPSTPRAQAQLGRTSCTSPGLARALRAPQECSWTLQRSSAGEERKSGSESLKYTGAIDCLRRIQREEGLPRLFVGLRLACLKTAVTNFIYFYLLRALKPLLGRLPLLQGSCAGAGVQMIVLPIDMIVTRLQSAQDKADIAKVLRGIIAQQGVLGLWSGLGPGLLLTLNPGITQGILARFQKSLRGQTALQAFWAGAVAKAVASTLTYPYMRAKVLMQVRGMRAAASAPTSAIQVLSSLLAEGGVQNLFDGLCPQLTNAVLKEALLNLMRVKITIFVARLFGSMRKLSSRP
eukprot:TRINITY_DN3867_c0_g1_i1.p1 TRINITY_DN3867_c0_g1~~TRINITY_DN3867_c0_g1_i1.p1  ORF type:complete len:337 (-),score=47.78 TRINITY_DN3867_c0_g1_i1:327-1337(-)